MGSNLQELELQFSEVALICSVSESVSATKTVVSGQAEVIRKCRSAARDLDARVSAISQQLVNFDFVCMDDWLHHQIGQSCGFGS